MQLVDKTLPNLHKPEDTLAWKDQFKNRCDTSKKTDVKTDGDLDKNVERKCVQSIICAILFGIQEQKILLK